MIKRWFKELLEEMGIKFPEKKKVIVDMETLPDGATIFSMDRFNNMAQWEVRWRSRNGDYSGDTSSEVAAFTDRRTAEAFAQTLRDAHKILRNTNSIGIRIEKVK